MPSPKREPPSVSVTGAVTSTTLSYIARSVSLIRVSPTRPLSYRRYRLRRRMLTTLLLSLWQVGAVVAVVVLTVLLIAVRRLYLVLSAIEVESG